MTGTSSSTTSADRVTIGSISSASAIGPFPAGEASRRTPVTTSVM